MHKKIIAILGLALLLSGCALGTNKKNPEPDNSNAEISFEQGSDINAILQSYLEAGQKITQLQHISRFQLPEGVTREQLETNKKYYNVADLYFTLAFRNNSNFPIKSESNFSGILVARVGDGGWNKFYEIKNKDNAINNPLSFWNVGSKLFLSVVDTNGAGSGEGVMKLLSSTDFGKTWNVERCFYDAIDFGCQWGTRDNLSTSECKQNEYIYRKDSQTFTKSQYNKETQKDEVIEQKSCLDLEAGLPPESISLTLNTTEWLKESSIAGLSFSYPPELTYRGGGDIDNGSFSWITGANQDDVYFRIFNTALFKCNLKDQTQCNLGTLVPATPKEVFDIAIKGFNVNEDYESNGDISIGNIIGKKFTLKKEFNGNDARTIILVQGARGVYSFQDVQQVEDNELFDLFLQTFQVK